jgi:hypothetical protein
MILNLIRFCKIILFIIVFCSCQREKDIKQENDISLRKLRVTDTTFENYNFYFFYGKKVSDFLDFIVLDTLWTSGVNFVYYEENCNIRFNHGIMVSIYVHSDSIYQYLDSIKQNATREFNFEEFKNKKIYEIYINNQYHQRVFPTCLQLNPRDIVLLVKILDYGITSIWGQDNTIWNKYLDEHYIKVCDDFKIFTRIFWRNNILKKLLDYFK